MRNFRLAYMEALILTKGEFCRNDVQTMFGLGSACVARDIKWYRENFPGNVIYCIVERRFKPSPTFEPKVLGGTVEEFLDALNKVDVYF